MKSLKFLLLVLFFASPAIYPVQAHQDPEFAGYINVEGGRIWYRLNGAEHLGKTPAIIMMHGGPGGTHRSNMPYVALSDTYPVILYDQLGTGNSERPDDMENWTVERYVSEIDSIRKALNLEEVIIAGHSWGGTLSAEYAVKRPKGLKAAILSSPLLDTHQWVADNQIWIDALPEADKAAIAKHEAAGTTEHPDYLKASETFYSRHMCRQDPCPDNGYRDAGPVWSKKIYEYMWGPTEFFAPGTLKDYSVSDQLKNINVPTLMICGEFDEAAPKSCKKFAGMITGVPVENVVVPNAGHATMAENEKMYMDTVRAFLEKVLK